MVPAQGGAAGNIGTAGNTGAYSVPTAGTVGNAPIQGNFGPATQTTGAQGVGAATGNVGTATVGSQAAGTPTTLYTPGGLQLHVPAHACTKLCLWPQPVM